MTSTSTLSRAHEQIAAKADDFALKSGGMDAHLRHAVMRMMTWCERNNGAAAFLARGIVIDTMGDLAQQIHAYFPSHIDVTPVIEDIAFVAAESAADSGQRFQEIQLGYIGDGKIPEAARANMQTLVKWYSPEMVSGGNYDGHEKKLKPGWSGGAGAPMDMLKMLNLGTKKGFLLQVCALDIKDARAQELLGDTGIMQALGGSPDAVAAAADVLAAGGADAKQLQAVIEQIIEIKHLKAALLDAGTTPQAPAIAAALAVKTEALSAIVTVLPAIAAAPLHKESARIVEIVKTDLTARQFAQAVETLSRALPAPMMARVANDMPPSARLPAQISRAVEAVMTIARTQNMPVRDIAALTLTGKAAPEMVAPIKALTSLLAQPEALPTLERALPASVMAPVREALVTPVLQASTTQAHVSLPAIVETLQVMAVKSELPTIKMAAVALEQAAQPVEPNIMASAMRGPLLQAVSENLQALALTSSVPQAQKTELQVVIAQVEAVIVQDRTPPHAPQMDRQDQVIVPATSPIVEVAKAVGVTPPATVPPASVQPGPVAPQATETIKQAGPAQSSAPPVNADHAPTPAAVLTTPSIAPATAPATPVRGFESPIARVAEAIVPQDRQAAAKTKETATPDGKCPDCKKGFNCAACELITEAAVASMEAEIQLDVVASILPKTSLKIAS